MIRIISVGAWDSMSSPIHVLAVLDGPESVDVEAEWAKFENAKNLFLGLMPLDYQSPGYRKQQAAWNKKKVEYEAVLRKRYQLAPEIASDYLLSHAFVSELITNHGFKTIEYVEVHTEE
jgi:hypothetical protein